MAKVLFKNYSDPEICPANPTATDMKTADGKNKIWIIHFRYYNSSTSEWEVFKFKSGINYVKGFKQRLAAAAALRDSLREKLECGWNAITNTFPVDLAANPLDNNIARLSFNDALRFALKECKVAPGTLKEYRLTMNRMIESSGTVMAPMASGGESAIDIGIIPIGQIKKFHIKLLLEQCYRDNKWSDKSWNKHLGNLQGLFSRLVDNDVFEHNPTHDIKFLNVVESDKYKPLTAEEKKIIREEIYLHHFGFFVYLMTIYHAGLRPFEALALRISDLRMESKMIKIEPERSRNNSKTKSIRYVPMNEHLYVLVKQWISGYEDKDFYVFGSPYTSGRGNAGSSKGGFSGAMHPDYFKPSLVRIKRDTVTRLWRTLGEKLGIENHMYALKRTGGDDKILAGIELDTLRDLYGHQNKRMTEIYAKRIKEVYANEIRSKSPAF